MMRITFALLCTTILLSAISFSQGPNPRPQSWASCEKFDGVVTPNSLPVEGRFDPLYMMPGHKFKDGVPLISAFKPGDGSYNGGRWHLYVLKEGVDASKYVNACSVEALDMNDFQATDKYFTCPLLPIRGRN